MRAMQVTAYDQPLSEQELEMPVPAAGEVLIKVETCGLNFGDLLMIKGTYQQKPICPLHWGWNWRAALPPWAKGLPILPSSAYRGV